MAKMGGTGVIDTVAKMGETLHDKNGWNSLWQKKGGTGVKVTVTKMVGAHRGKNG